MLSLKHSLASVLIFCSLSMCSGQILWDQQPNTNLTTVIDLEIAKPAAMFSTYLLNDVTISVDTVASSVTTYYSNNSGEWPTTISEARLCIFSDDFSPFDPRIDGEIVPVSVTEISSGVLAITANIGVNLSPGVHWIGLTPVLDPSTGAQEFRFDAGSTVGADSVFRNPLNGFGLGADWMNADVLSPGFGDAAITVRGGFFQGINSPDTASIFRGTQISGQPEDTFTSDDQRWVFNPGFTLNSTEAPVWIVFDGPPLDNADFSINAVSVESQSSTPGLTLTVEEFNFSTNAYVVIGEENESFNVDVQRFVNAIGHESSTGEVRCRVGWRQTGFTLQFPWEVRIDAVAWRFCN